MMHVELQTCCSSLGYQEGEVYHKEPDCLETVKELIRFLKREDDSCEIRRQLGSAQILQNDLLPMLKQFPEEKVLWETLIRLMVNLTQPAVLCFQNHVPEDKTSRKYYLEIEADLQAYKESFADEALFAVLTKKLGDLLQLDWEHRQEEDRMLIERLLILVRNILHVPPNTGKEQRTDDDASVHDQVLWALHVSGMEDLLLYLASSDEERNLSLHVMEIISLMFREQTPEQLASAGTTMTASEREKEERELAMVREMEKAKKREAMMKYNSRHSRFGGTFTVANMKSISDKEVIYHHSVNSAKTMSFDVNKTRRRKPKNRKPITAEELKRKSTLSIRLFLKEFCVQFLVNCYNPLMHSVKDTLVRNKAQENDETYYLWAMRFFMEFQRRNDFRVDTISETVSVGTFHYIHNNLVTYHDMLLTNKKEGVMWSKRMYLALRAYHEMLSVLCAMDRSKDPALRENAKVIKGNVFYVMEYRDIFVTLLKKFDETKQSRAFLRELIEANHLFMKMLEVYSSHNKHLLVQKKSRKGRKKKAKKDPPPVEAPSQEDLENLWDDVSGELSAIFQGRGQPLPEDVTPFDAASEVDLDQQKAEAMGRIQDCLRSSRPAEAVALFRAARDVWTSGEEFGRPDISPEDEFMALREVFFAELAPPAPSQPEEGPEDEDDDQDQEVMEEEMEGAPVYSMSEQEFSFKEYVARFANPHIVRSYIIILKSFQTNSVGVNHAIIKMFHRLGYECNMMALLYQASLFRIFQKIICSSVGKTAQFKEIAGFATHVVRQFFEHAEKNNKIFVELFFYKTVKEAYEITEGYGMTMESTKGKVAWTEEQESELRQLFEQYQDAPPEEKEGLDAADYIMKYILDATRPRRQIVRHLVGMGLIGGWKELQNKKSKRPPRIWAEEEEAELLSLFRQYRDSDYIMADILAGLTVHRSKQAVIGKILELGLVSDRKELRKKPKSGGRRKKNEENMEEDMREDVPADVSDDESVHDSSSASEVSSADSSGGGSDSDSDDDTPTYIKHIRKMAKKMRAKGMGGAVEWVQNAVNQVADDREEDGDTEPIPLIPITEEQEDAVEERIFQKLLRRLGLQAPDAVQERFWRISGRLLPMELRYRTRALDLPKPAGEAGEDTPGEKKSKERFNKLRALAKEKKKAKEDDDGKRGKGMRKSRFRANPDAVAATDSPQTSDSEADGPTPARGASRLDDRDEGNNDGIAVSTPSSPVISRKRRNDSESDNSEDESLVPREMSGTTNKAASPSSRPSKRARLVDSSSEEEGEEEEQPVDMETNDAVTLETPPEATNTETAAESFPATMLTQPPDSDSDSDVEDHIPLRRHVKRATIESDSDDD